MNELETSWNATLQAFGKEYEDKVVFDSVFTLLKAKELTNDELIVTIDSLFNIGYIEEDVPTLEYLFNQITNRDVQLTILSEKEYQEKYVNHEDAEEYNFDDSLNPAFTFENFVVGNSNRIAQNASLAVAMKPGESFSPLFIYSNSGLGKTHLLNAIGNFVKGHNKNAHVLYCTSEQFVNEYIASLSNGSMDTFNYKYRHVDVLLVDDIQFIASKESSSEMFFNIINTLQNQKKQIVITSDKPPKDLKGMEKRLVSRFAQGLTITIDTPEFETAKAIIQKKIEIEKVDYPIDDEVFNFMA
ncbi:MAG: ATP-binding protein, partial [Erysipelotrichaceae bacterium]|nr:ATP-binding protein [Erysipelotrichaceae bacterium]